MNFDPNAAQPNGAEPIAEPSAPLEEAPADMNAAEESVTPSEENEVPESDASVQKGGAFSRRGNDKKADAPAAYHGRFSSKQEQPVSDDAPLDSLDDGAAESESQDVPAYFPENTYPDIPEADALPETAAERRKNLRAVKKGRPRRRKGEGLFGIPNILATGVWVALTLIIGVTLGRIVWVCASEILAFGREDRAVTITVYETDTIDDITRKLSKAELIHYPGLFKLYAKFAVDDGDIQAGIWDLNTKYDYHALVKMMSPSSTRSTVKVMIPEGYSCRQIFALLEENKVCTVQDIESYAASGELDDYWFLDGVTRGDRYCLEGFLFPDTYEFYQNDSPKNVLTKMLNNFDTRFDESMRGKIQTLNTHLTALMQRGGKSQDYINSHQFTVRDVVIVASMIEKETSSAEEGYTIASVIYNRLFCWGSNPAYLNIDATIIYALDGKTDLTADDLRVDSPYNTYTNVGLTPGPISNPGLTSLLAALEPSDTNYYYYVLDPSAGSHVFSSTQEEHEANRARLGE